MAITRDGAIRSDPPGTTEGSDMLLKMAALGATLALGYRSWRTQAAINDRQQLQAAGEPRPVREAARRRARAPASRALMMDRDFRIQLDSRETTAALVAVGFASAGLIYAPASLACVPFVLYASKRFFIIAGRQLRRGKIDVESLLVISILGSLLTGRFFIASLIRLITQASLWLINAITAETHQQLQGIFAEAPDSVWLLVDGVEVATPFQEIRPDDRLVIHAGETVPADGRIVAGVAGIDERMLTGEATPVEKADGEAVYALTTVLSGQITVQVERAGADTAAARIAEIMTRTADFRTDTMLRSEVFSRQLVNPALLASAMAWLVIGPVGAVAVLLTHPQYRLNLTTPISLLKYLQFASRSGILVKDARSLELLGEVDTVVFDKTGTLTEEEPRTGAIHAFHGHNEDTVLALAAAAEQHQSHPLARAIRGAARCRDLEVPTPEHSEYHPGEGLRVHLHGQRLLVGSERLLARAGVALSADQQALLVEIRAAGHVPVLVALGGHLVGIVELCPSPRPEALETLRQLRQCQGIRQICILSGDAEEPTRRLAESLGVDRYFARVLPEQKAGVIAALQAEGRSVCFVGDGINDAIALKQARVSVSLAGASRIATDTAQIVLLDGGIGHLPALMNTAVALDQHMNVQFGGAVAVSVSGVAGVFIGGWGLAQVVALNQIGIFAKLGYALLDRPRSAGRDTRARHAAPPEWPAAPDIAAHRPAEEPTPARTARHWRADAPPPRLPTALSPPRSVPS